jgi:hypothetical protein
MELAASGQRVLARLGPSRAAVACDVGTPVGQQHQHGRVAAARNLLHQRVGRFECGGQRRAATAGQARQRAFGASQRTGRCQQQVGAAAAKGDQGHAVAAHIAVGQQQLDCTLGLGQPVQRR